KSATGAYGLKAAVGVHEFSDPRKAKSEGLRPATPEFSRITLVMPLRGPYNCAERKDREARRVRAALTCGPSFFYGRTFRYCCRRKPENSTTANRAKGAASRGSRRRLPSRLRLCGS